MKTSRILNRLSLILLLCMLMAVGATAQDLTLPAVELREVARGFTAPIALLSPPGDEARRFIIDQIGVIHILNADDELLETPFLDIRERLTPLRTNRNDPRGLLSMAFHPQFHDNGRFFVFYTVPPREDSAPTTQYIDVLSEMVVDPDAPNVAVLDSERVIMEFEHQTLEHSGGQLLFSPEGYLYIALGDDDRPADTSQNIESPFGGILRIDVDNVPEGATYGIPADNPYVGVDGLDELYAKGFRHPWRISYDTEFGFLVSEPAWTFRASEINQVVSGGNYGWNVDPTACYDDQTVVTGCLQADDGTALLPPVLEYDNSVGRIVIGGYVYRGSAIPDLQGYYVFGEWGVQVRAGAQVFAALPSAEGRWQFAQLIERPFRAGMSVWAFGQDAQGELYVTSMLGSNITGRSGVVYQLVAADE